MAKIAGAMKAMTSQVDGAGRSKESLETAPACPFLHVIQTAEGKSLVYFPFTGGLVTVPSEWGTLLRAVEVRLSAEAVSMDDLIREAEGAGQESLAGVLNDLAQSGHAVNRLGELHGKIRTDTLGVDALLSHRPRNLMLLVTDACNLACTYCYELTQGVHTLGKNMSRETARIAIDEYLKASAGRGNVAITFFGGEPLINFRLIKEVVQWSEEWGRSTGVVVSYTMTTNLTLLTSEIADFLVAKRFAVMVSIDGDEEEHDRNRKTKQGGGTHRKVVANLELLTDKYKAAGLRLPKLRATIDGNGRTPREVHEYLLGLGTGLVNIGSSTEGSWPTEAEECHENPDRDLVQKEWRQLAAIVREAEGDVSESIPPHLRDELNRVAQALSKPPASQVTGPGPELCGVCRNMKAVSADGTIYPCHRYVGMDEFRLGRAGEGGLKQQRVVEYYEKIENALGKTCARCWAHVLCAGVCPWTLSSEDGTVSAPDERGCSVIRAHTEAKLEVLAAMHTSGRGEERKDG